MTTATGGVSDQQPTDPEGSSSAAHVALSAAIEARSADIRRAAEQRAEQQQPDRRVNNRGPVNMSAQIGELLTEIDTLAGEPDNFRQIEELRVQISRRRAELDALSSNLEKSKNQGDEQAALEAPAKKRSRTPLRDQMIEHHLRRQQDRNRDRSRGR